MATGLTASQREVLEWFRANDRGPFSITGAAAAAALGRPASGLHQTAASLVRRRYLERRRGSSKRGVGYLITRRGREALR